MGYHSALQTVGFDAIRLGCAPLEISIATLSNALVELRLMLFTYMVQKGIQRQLQINENMNRLSDKKRI